jgi:hypothetical protein
MWGMKRVLLGPGGSLLCSYGLSGTQAQGIEPDCRGLPNMKQRIKLTFRHWSIALLPICQDLSG